MLKHFLLLLTDLVLTWEQAPSCDPAQFKNLLGKQEERPSLAEMQSFLSEVHGCEGPEWDQIRNETYYHVGVHQLSLSQEQDALDTFEQISLTCDDKSTLCQLTRKRVEELYKKYGKWDKIGDEDDDKANYMELENQLQKYEGNELTRLYDELLVVSPLNSSLRISFANHLLEEVRSGLDLHSAQLLVDQYQFLIGKHTKDFSLSKRVDILYRAAAIQWFVLNMNPSRNVKSCLRIDMDYKPCRDMMKMWSKWSKSIKVSTQALLDPEEYCSISQLASTSAIKFMIKDKPIMRDSGKSTFKNNYQLYQAVAERTVSYVLNSQPFSDTKLTPVDMSGDQNEFQTVIDVLLCIAYDAEGKDADASSFCSKALKQVLTADEFNEVKRYNANSGDANRLSEVLKVTFNLYPHLAVHLSSVMSHKLTRRSNSGGASAHWAVLNEFFKTHSLVTCKNSFAKKVYGTIKKGILKEQQQQKQRNRQNQYYQQQYRQQQQQQQQQQLLQMIHKEKDYYKILNVPKSASSKEIRRAYLSLTKKYHPDKQGKLEEDELHKIQEKMSEINEAYGILGDETKRKEYDTLRVGSQGNAGNAGNANPFRHSGFGRGSRQREFKFGGNNRGNGFMDWDFFQRYRGTYVT